MRQTIDEYKKGIVKQIIDIYDIDEEDATTVVNDEKHKDVIGDGFVSKLMPYVVANKIAEEEDLEELLADEVEDDDDEDEDDEDDGDLDLEDEIG